MRFSHFFIDRPIFAGVLSILITLIGGICLFLLPISEYPEVAPPTVVVSANYPGANPQVVSDTVASPLEQAINGVENMIYMSSQSTADGVMTLTVTFKIGTDLDTAQVQVQNRVSQVMPKLPEIVRQLGVTTLKSSPDLSMVINLYSPDNTRDSLYLSNYANIHLKDILTRIDGVGQAQVFGAGEYAMRIWLNPDQMALRNLTPGDVINAVREQNIQVAAGSIGAAPVAQKGNFEYLINTKGRLVSEEEFENIIIKTGPHGETVLLKEVARLELGATGYSLRSMLNDKQAAGIGVFQMPGSNALNLSKAIRAKIEELSKNFPPGVDYVIDYDPTIFVSRSIDSVIVTLLEAIVLVVFVVILFLQTWRASIIPLLAVPVSVIGTFAVMYFLGYTINTLTLFGLVLSIGIVVDDAIVVVENVERHIALGEDPKAATHKAMEEVSGPIIAVALVLCAVFIPTAFISGLTGKFYSQFAVTIAISTVISAFNSLTLSPALSALLLRGHHDKKDIFTRVIDFLLGWFFKIFNFIFDKASHAYAKTVRICISLSIVALIGYGVLLWQSYVVFYKTPQGFVPTQDKQYLVAFAMLPNAASIDRTQGVLSQMGEIVKSEPGVHSGIAFPGLSINGFTASSNEGIIFVSLKPFEERTSPELSAEAIAGKLNAKFSGIKDAFIMCVNPPPVSGMGSTGGFKLQIQDRATLGANALQDALNAVMGATMDKQTPEGQAIGMPFSTYTVNVPQLSLEVNREKAKSLNISLQTLYETLQVYLGSQYINDFNIFGRTYQVIAQADAEFRDEVTDITSLKTRNLKGEMVPIGSVATVTETAAPNRIQRYNGYPSAELSADSAPGFSSVQAEAAIENILKKVLPNGMDFEWTDLTFQQRMAGNTAVYIFPLCVLLVFLVLAAQYESLRLPLAIVLIVPLCLLSALIGVSFKGGDNNIFTQIGLIVLVGLACKNAILIVEFAKTRQDAGLSAKEAAIEACRLRLRPILMTSIAFIAGVFPLVIAKGAGAEMRQAMGLAVFSGMIGVTIFGLFFTPVFYYLLMSWGNKEKTPRAHTPG